MGLKSPVLQFEKNALKTLIFYKNLIFAFLKSRLKLKRATIKGNILSFKSSHYENRNSLQRSLNGETTKFEIRQ